MKAGCVIIGRNEAARLPATFASVQTEALPAVYVDSGSHDNSVELARSEGAKVVELDPARPFTAARARNEGLASLVHDWPDLTCVMFLDGDCRLEPRFVERAAAKMSRDDNIAVIVGHLREENEKHSIYTQMCGNEWKAPTGKISDFNSFGGIMLVRIADFRAVGGFNPDMIAGEDPEFAIRLALAGRDAQRIDAPMAVHRADIIHFRQWWQRSVRGGHAMAHRYRLHGASVLQDSKRQYWSTIFWGGAVPACAILLAPFTGGLSLLLMGGYVVLGLRMKARFRRDGADAMLASRLAGFGLLAKFANFVGVVRFWLHERSGKTQLVEYK